MAILPWAQLTAYKPADAIGTLQSESSWAIWNLVDFDTTQYTNLSGFEKSPDGNYLLQKCVPNPLDADHTLWSKGVDDTGTYDDQIDPATGKKGLYQKNGSIGTVIDTVYQVQHYADVYGGFSVKLQRGSPPDTLAAYNADNYYLRLILNWPVGGYAVGMPPLFAIVIAAGEPVALQVSTDNVTWKVVDTIDGSDSEANLDSGSRTITFDVVPLFDISWWNGLPQSRAQSRRPPDSLQINVTGALSGQLIYNQDRGTFSPGSLAISGLGGEFGVWYTAREYAPFSTASTGIWTNPVVFYTTAEPSMAGYFPFGASWTVDPVYPAGTINQVSATIVVQSGSGTGINLVNSLTGNAYATVALNMLHLYYEPQFYGPLGGAPEWQINFGMNGNLPPSLTDGPTKNRIYRWRSSEVFQQVQFCRRDTLDVTVVNEDFLFVPGRLPLANRIVTWSTGWTDDESGQTYYEDPGFIGQVSTDPERKGFKWSLVDNIHYADLKFSDLLNDNIQCGYMPPMDDCNMYFVMRQIGYKWGFSDDRMLFPYRTIDDDTPGEYRLDSGGGYAPKWQPSIDERLIDFALRVRDVCGAIDPSGAVDRDGNPLVVPMVLYVDSLGNLRFEAWSVGWANSFSASLSPQPTPAKTFTTAEQFVDGESQLAQFARTPPETSVDLTTVRTNIQLVGINPIDGTPVRAGAVSNLLDGSPSSDPDAPGYLGYPLYLAIADAQYTSQETVDQVLDVMEQQVSFPVLSANFEVLMQPGMHALTGFFGYPFIGIDEFGLTGTDGPVAFWIDGVESEGFLARSGDGAFTPEAYTKISARGVGQAGD